MNQEFAETVLVTGQKIRINKTLHRATSFVSFGDRVVLCIYPEVPAIAVGLKNEDGIYEHAGDLTVNYIGKEPFLSLHSIAIERIWLNDGDTIVLNHLAEINDLAVHVDLKQKERWWDMQEE